jgi:hypothetical protein
MTPQVNPHLMVTQAKDDFRLPGYEGGVWGPDEQWDMGTCFPAPQLQRRHRQVGLHTQVPL